MRTPENNHLPTCLNWSKADIQAQGERHGIKIDDAEAQDLLEGFFEEANDNIIEIINIMMACYVRDNYEEQ